MNEKVQLDFRTQIERILDKLQQVREANSPSFGSEKHEFRLAERLSDEAVHRFENQHGIHLPEDYRQFLMLAGGSGAGPYYGILPLDKWDSVVGSYSSLPADYLARPSPLVPGTEPKLSSADNESVIDPRGERFQGSIALVSQGCSCYAVLIISGPARGRVAYVNEEYPQTSYFPENPNFLSWYERWLDELRAGYETSWFGVGAVGTEEELARRLRDRTVSAGNKSDALRTLMRIKPLRPSTMELLSAFSKDTSEAPAPRATAASLSISHSPSDDPVYVSQLLQDSLGEVRKEALLALMRKKSPMLADAVRQRIHDTDPKVAHSALLHGKGILTRNDLGPLVKSENVELRRTAIYALGHAADVRVDELVALASSDTDQFCRTYAIQALGDLNNRDAVAPLRDLLELETDKLVRTNILRALHKIES